MTAEDHLRALVEALENAFISTWQSTAAWQTELDAAKGFLEDTRDAGYCRHWQQLPGWWTYCVYCRHDERKGKK